MKNIESTENVSQSSNDNQTTSLLHIPQNEPAEYIMSQLCISFTTIHSGLCDQ